MIIGILTIKLYAPWVHSLKEKRMVLQSLVQKLKNKFNISVAEVDEQDTHQTIILGIATVTNSKSHAESICNEIINFIEANSEAQLLNIQTEFL